MRVIDKVTGTTRSTVVTLSKNAEPSAVSREREIKILIGFPCAPFAALMATYWKTPDLLVMFTKIIIPMSSVIVPHSICFVKALCKSTTPTITMNAAPRSAMTARLIFSEIIMAYVIKKTAIAK
ncbi:Uncharacterised protein [Streptococcus pneumoniae]|nr:Uncharacterised protein [Streptococcus pneumoniae]CEY37871.1 Uncharacterised protein [Streptococcus pneumoniae]